VSNKSDYIDGRVQQIADHDGTRDGISSVPDENHKGDHTEDNNLEQEYGNRHNEYGSKRIDYGGSVREESKTNSNGDSELSSENDLDDWPDYDWPPPTQARPLLALTDSEPQYNMLDLIEEEQGENLAALEQLQ